MRCSSFEDFFGGGGGRESHLLNVTGMGTVQHLQGAVIEPQNYRITEL